MEQFRSGYDSQLFEGTAWYYARYRPSYPPLLFEHLATYYHLNGTSKILDLGCGTGQLTVGLAPYAEQVLGIDPDEEMLQLARQKAAEAKIPNVQFLQGSSWDLSPTLGNFQLVTMGESFHWMERESVLRTLYDMTLPEGGVTIISRKFHAPAMYEKVVDETLKQFLGEKRRAGQGYYSHPPERHEVVLARSLFTMLETWSYEYEQDRTIDEVLGFLYSTSYASKRLFGDQIESFETKLHRRLLEIEPRQTFTFKIVVTALLGAKE